MLVDLLFVVVLDVSDVAMVEESPSGEDEAFGFTKELWLDEETKEPLPRRKTGGGRGKKDSGGPSIATFANFSWQYMTTPSKSG